MSEPRQGDAAPPIELPLDNGDMFRSADHFGRALVVFSYPKDDTNGCTAEARDFTRLAPEFAELDIGLVGISPDGVQSHAGFKTKHGLCVPLAADVERSAIEDFDVWKEKSMYGRKYMGVERSTFFIDRDGRIAREWRKVSVPGHVEEVLAAARAIAAFGTANAT